MSHSSPGRDAFFDNAKYLAIVLVACAHSWEAFRDGSRTVSALYLFVYTFHMPTFIIISGYFSRGFALSSGKLRRLTIGLLVPYVLFETGYACFRRWADNDPGYPVSIADPWFLTWFLLALFLWRLTVPLWQSMRRPLVIALGFSVGGAMVPGIGPELGMQRVLQFLPFFVLGLQLRPEHFARLRCREVRLVALSVAAGTLAFAYWAAPRVNREWLYRQSSGPELGVSPWIGGIMALALFGASLLMVACFVAWVPRRRTWFTVLGAGTLYGYLLHGFAVKLPLYRGWFDHVWLHTPLGTAVVTVTAGGAVTVLCTGPVRRVFRTAVEPRLEWLFRPDATAQSRGRVHGESHLAVEPVEPEWPRPEQPRPG